MNDTNKILLAILTIILLGLLVFRVAANALEVTPITTQELKVVSGCTEVVDGKVLLQPSTNAVQRTFNPQQQ